MLKQRLQLHWRVLKDSIWNFVDDDIFTMAAALSFYSALSIAPILTMLLFIAGRIGPVTEDRITNQVQIHLGEHASDAIQLIIENANRQPSIRNITGIISIGVIVFTSTLVFVQLQWAMNRIWGVAAKPEVGIWPWLRSRLLSIGMIFSVGFLLLVSMVISSLMATVFDRTGFWGQTLHQVASFAVITVLFAAIYKVLPDAKLPWRRVWIGAAVTAALFTLGKYLIGLYLGNTEVGSSYGAAGSLMVLLIWVYYSAIVVLYGAEWSHAHMRAIEGEPEAEDYAVEDHDVGEEQVS
jgi:membrane protein